MMGGEPSAVARVDRFRQTEPGGRLETQVPRGQDLGPSPHEHAERMAGGVGEDVEGLVVIGTIEQLPRPEGQGAASLTFERVGIGHGEVEVHLHGDRAVRPGRRFEILVELKRERSPPVGVREHEPVGRIRPVSRRFVARPMPQPEERAVELREFARSRASRTVCRRCGTSLMTASVGARAGPRAADTGRMAQLSEKDVILGYALEKLNAIVTIVEEMDDDTANSTLPTPGSNSPYALLTHCLGAIRRWSSTVNLGITIPRDRDAEFVATGPVQPLIAGAARQRQAFIDDVAATDLDAPPAAPPADRRDDPARAYQVRDCRAVLLHVIEELAQHLGHLKITRDMLRMPR